MAVQNESLAIQSESSVDERYEGFLSRLSPKARAAMSKYEETCQNRGISSYSELWRRLAGSLSHLAPQFTDMVGFSVKFYIPDGKYRQQVFALETTQKGGIAVYIPDVTEVAIAQKILSPTSVTSTYQLPNAPHEHLELQAITADNCDTVVCKAMVSWGKKAIVTTLDKTSTPEQIATVESLCQIAAGRWPVTEAAPKAETV